jgi:hypothetical protein
VEPIGPKPSIPKASIPKPIGSLLRELNFCCSVLIAISFCITDLPNSVADKTARWGARWETIMTNSGGRFYRHKLQL